LKKKKFSVAYVLTKIKKKGSLFLKLLGSIIDGKMYDDCAVGLLGEGG
jgi:hypothetical protein